MCCTVGPVTTSTSISEHRVVSVTRPEPISNQGKSVPVKEQANQKRTGGLQSQVATLAVIATGNDGSPRTSSTTLFYTLINVAPTL